MSSSEALQSGAPRSSIHGCAGGAENVLGESAQGTCSGEEVDDRLDETGVGDRTDVIP
jgi:hypothetical protein